MMASSGVETKIGALGTRFVAIFRFAGAKSLFWLNFSFARDATSLFWLSFPSNVPDANELQGVLARGVPDPCES